MSWPTRAAFALLALAGGASASRAVRAARWQAALQSRVSAMSDNFIVRLGKSERQKAIDAWEIGDAWRPGTPNAFTPQPKDLVELHKQVIAPVTSAAPPASPPTYASADAMAGVFKKVPLVGAMMRTLTLADLALELSSPEPAVLKTLRQGDVRALPMSEATSGVPEEVGRLLTTLCYAMGARRTLDLGAFTGYSALSCALGMPEGGKVTCCEPEPRYAAMARANFDAAAPPAEIELLETTAEKCLSEVRARGELGAFDLVFVDADAAGFPAYFDGAYELLRPGGLLILHDTLWAEDRNLNFGDHPHARALNAAVARDGRYATLLVPLSFGLTFCVKVVDGESARPPPVPAAVRGSGAGACDPTVPGALADADAWGRASDEYVTWLRKRRAAVVAELEALPDAPGASEAAAAPAAAAAAARASASA